MTSSRVHSRLQRHREGIVSHSHCEVADSLLVVVKSVVRREEDVEPSSPERRDVVAVENRQVNGVRVDQDSRNSNPGVQVCSPS